MQQQSKVPHHADAAANHLCTLRGTLFVTSAASSETLLLQFINLRRDEIGCSAEDCFLKNLPIAFELHVEMKTN